MAPSDHIVMESSTSSLRKFKASCTSMLKLMIIAEADSSMVTKRNTCDNSSSLASVVRRSGHASVIVDDTEVEDVVVVVAVAAVKVAELVVTWIGFRACRASISSKPRGQPDSGHYRSSSHLFQVEGYIAAASKEQAPTCVAAVGACRLWHSGIGIGLGCLETIVTVRPSKIRVLHSWCIVIPCRTGVVLFAGHLNHPPCPH